MAKIVQDISFLRQKSEPVASVEEATALISDLQKALCETDNGIGLAAIQIGVPKRVGVIRVAEDQFVSLINPELVDKQFEFIYLNEGCLSFPNQFKDTRRYRQITIKNSVIDGDKFREEVQIYYYQEKDEETVMRDNPLTCIAVQHELDHFEGKLIHDFNIKYEPIVNAVAKVGRNEPCPCGSGKKYKKCCGK